MTNSQSSRGTRSATITTTSTTITNGPHTTTTRYTTTGPQTTVTNTGGLRSSTVAHPTITTTHQIAFPRAPSASAATQTQRHPSIRIRRDQTAQAITEPSLDHGHRRRSSSEPQRPPSTYRSQDDLEIQRQVTAGPLHTLHEEGSASRTAQLLSVPPAARPRSSQRPGWGRQFSAISLRGGDAGSGAGEGHDAPEYTPGLVDMLDVIDPEVATLTTLNNVQNSLFIPNLGPFYRRQPTYTLSQPSLAIGDEETTVANAVQDYEKRPGVIEAGQGIPERPPVRRVDTISSVLTGISEGHNYAVLPHGASLPGWTPEEKAMLNDHVRHLLHSKREGFKRSMRGFSRYVRKPVGFLITLYASLITFWGTAWVLFLIGWIGVGNRQSYFIEICDQVLVALFCVVGIGFSPWRAVDTYHMIFVAHYAHLTWKLRKKRGLPELKDQNELPRPDQDAEESVLTLLQQRKLEHHQEKLAKSHTFYKPRETTTHRAFSVKLLITIVVLLDCHSLFQMALGATTWGIYYKDRPKALTAVILACSISSNISAGITITIGDRRSRKKLVVEQMFRQDLTEEALKTLRKERGLEAEGIARKKSQIKKQETGGGVLQA